MPDRGPQPDVRRPAAGPSLGEIEVPDVFKGADDDPPPFRERRSRRDRRARRGRDTPMAITGVGAVTGYGWGRKQIWDGFRTGESAVRLATVATRQVWASSVPLPAGPSPAPNSPSTVWVLPTSTVSST